MSRFIFFMIFLVFNVAVRFGECENISHDCNIDNKSGFDKTHLSFFEYILKIITSLINKVADFVIDVITTIFGENNVKSQSNNVTRSSFGKILEENSEFMKLVLPGTLWCGSGNISKQESDLGILKKVDACCRSHDNCQSYMEPNEYKINIKNNGIFTRSSCVCDKKFYKCLKHVNDTISHEIGDLYFNIFKTQCFQCVCPTDDCNFANSTECNYSKEENTECAKYKWVDNDLY